MTNPPHSPPHPHARPNTHTHTHAHLTPTCRDAAAEEEALLEELSDLPYLELQGRLKQRGLPAIGRREELARRLAQDMLLQGQGPEGQEGDKQGQEEGQEEVQEGGGLAIR